MDITLKHVVALKDVGGPATDPLRGWRSLDDGVGEDDKVEVIVEYDVTYHYDAGGWTDYGGDPPSHSLDINESKVVDWSFSGGITTEQGVIFDAQGVEWTKDEVQGLYDAWADQHGDEIEGELFDKIQDGAGDWGDDYGL